MDLLTQLEAAFNTLRAAKIVKTQKDFAALIGYSAPAISNAFKGNPRYLTEIMVARAQRVVAERTGESTTQAEPDIVIPAATAKMYADMAESIRILSELVAAQQKGAGKESPAASGF